jgi:hypothetical protein
MKHTNTFYLFLILLSISTLFSQETDQLKNSREYMILLGAPRELELIATSGVTLNKAFSDLYYRGIAHRIPPRIKPFTEVIWSAYWTFFFSMWPHDAGHWARAEQLGGTFKIKKFGFPFPEAEMDLPKVLTPEEEALPSIGGFEINTLMKRQTHTNMYSNGFSYADELIHSFIQEIYFPFYAFIIAPADPKKPDTWLDTYGDPVESTLTVYRWYTGRLAIKEDGTVDPDLLDYYNETIYVSLLWTLFNPLLYQSAKAFGTDMTKDYGLMFPWMIGNENLAWIWGTDFNVSPLGYELYLQNYFRMKGKLYTVYMKYGRPFKNTGVGISIPQLIKNNDFNLGIYLDIWDQEKYGRGIAISLNSEYRINSNWGLTIHGWWKQRGYLIGKRIDDSEALLAGFNYKF